MTETPPIDTLVIIDDQLEKIEGHYYEYDKSVASIARQHGIKTVMYGHCNMNESFRIELNAKPWFSLNTQSKVRKIPVLGAILYRTAFWKKYEHQIKSLIDEVNKHSKNYLLFFPNVYWYNIPAIARALKDVKAPSALLYRTSVYDTIGLPKAMQPVTLGLVRSSVNILQRNKKAFYFTDSEVIANEWTAAFNVPMRVLPIPHLEINRKDAPPHAANKVRMYLPGGMRIEKGVQLLTESLELLAATNPQLLRRIILVTQFPGKDEELQHYKKRLAALPLENIFLGRLSTEEYNNELKMADVILIPYQVSEGYRARTSGILAEAIASEKPFITTDGTWMSVQAKKYDTGIIVPDNQPQQLANAIEKINNDYLLYYNKAAAAAINWMKAQSKEVFWGQMVSIF